MITSAAMATRRTSQRIHADLAPGRVRVIADDADVRHRLVRPDHAGFRRVALRELGRPPSIADVEAARPAVVGLVVERDAAPRTRRIGHGRSLAGGRRRPVGAWRHVAPAARACPSPASRTTSPGMWSSSRAARR